MMDSFPNVRARTENATDKVFQEKRQTSAERKNINAWGKEAIEMTEGETRRGSWKVEEEGTPMEKTIILGRRERGKLVIQDYFIVLLR